MISRVRSAWSGLWFADSAPERMAAFRIAFGAYLMAYWGALAPHVEVYFSNRGIQAPYLVPDYAPGPALAQLLFWSTFGLIALFTAGVGTRLVAPPLLVAYLYHYFLQLAVKHSAFERLIIIYLLVCCLAECDARFSVRAFRHPKRSPGPVPIWAERVLRFQTIALYLGSGLWKMLIPAWRDGTLLWATMQSLWATPLAFQIVRVVQGEQAWALLSWVVMGGEVLLAGLFCLPRTRNLACALGVLFHLANCFVLVVPEFLVAVAPYTLFWRSSRPNAEAAHRAPGTSSG